MLGGYHPCVICTDTGTPLAGAGSAFVCQKCLHLAAQLWPSEAVTVDRLRELRAMVADLGGARARPLAIPRGK